MPKNVELYCLHELSSDDVHPAPDRATAQLWAAQWTLFWHWKFPKPHPYDPIMSFVVARWPWDADSHAKSLARSIADNSFPPENAAAQAIEARKDQDEGLVHESAVSEADGPKGASHD